MTVSHGLDWASLLPAAKYAGSWCWPCVGVAALVAAHVATSEPRSKACHGAGLSSDALVCLGDGGMLDPATSLIWQPLAPSRTCADIEPLAQWRPATEAELSVIEGRSRRLSQPAPAPLCVNDTLVRIQPAGPA